MDIEQKACKNISDISSVQISRKKKPSATIYKPNGLTFVNILIDKSIFSATTNSQLLEFDLWDDLTKFTKRNLQK